MYSCPWQLEILNEKHKNNVQQLYGSVKNAPQPAQFEMSKAVVTEHVRLFLGARVRIHLECTAP